MADRPSCAARVPEHVRPIGESSISPTSITKYTDRNQQVLVKSTLTPILFATTAKLTALAQAAAESGGGYVAHMRSEADRFLEALDETIAIGRATG